MLNPVCEEGRGWEEFFNWADGGGDTIMNMATVAVKSMGRGHNIHVLGTSWGFLSCQGSFTPLGVLLGLVGAILDTGVWIICTFSGPGR